MRLLLQPLLHFEQLFFGAEKFRGDLARWKRDPDEDIVVLLDGLSGPVNEFYEFPRMSMLHSLNGEPVKSAPLRSRAPIHISRSQGKAVTYSRAWLRF